MMLVLVNAVRMFYFNFINVSKESSYLTEIFPLFFQSKHIVFLLMYNSVFSFNGHANTNYFYI